VTSPPRLRYYPPKPQTFHGDGSPLRKAEGRREGLRQRQRQPHSPDPLLDIDENRYPPLPPFADRCGLLAFSPKYKLDLHISELDARSRVGTWTMEAVRNRKGQCRTSALSGVTSGEQTGRYGMYVCEERGGKPGPACGQNVEVCKERLSFSSAAYRCIAAQAQATI
jgi:hypothetical protein